MTKQTQKTKLQLQIEKLQNRCTASTQTDLFERQATELETQRLANEATELEEEIKNLKHWHASLSEKIAGFASEHEQLLISGKTDEAEMIVIWREALLSKQAAIEGTIAERTMGTPQNMEAATDGLAKLRHPNRDFFLADMFDYALKDDGASMEAPIFTLSTKADRSIWQWESRDKSKSIKVTPSVLGRATQHDKDVLIYVVSQLTEALNRNREDANNRVVRFVVHDYLVTTNRGVGGDDYRRLQEAFERLAGTRITTNIKTGGVRVREGFGIIDRWKIVERTSDERMIAVEIVLSEWLFNAVQAFEVLTIHPDYFRLRKPIARRIYEIARKHCGRQASWCIGLPLLHGKSGSRGSIYEFHEAIKELVKANVLPEYMVSLSSETRVADVKVTFTTRDASRLVEVAAQTRKPKRK